MSLTNMGNNNNPALQAECLMLLSDNMYWTHLHSGRNMIYEFLSHCMSTNHNITEVSVDETEVVEMIAENNSEIDG